MEDDRTVLPTFDATFDAVDAGLPKIDVSACDGGPYQCVWLYDLECVRAKFGITDGGALTDADLARIVNTQQKQPCWVDPKWMSDKLICGYLCPGGRPPSRAVYRGRRHDISTIGGFFAESATREAASVLGFEELARVLERERAPVRLVRWARRSAREEQKHARMMSVQASRRGRKPRSVRALPVRRRSLYHFAKDNLIEGCIVEAHAALALVWSSEHAPPDLRAVFASIAKDETAHAGLAFEIHAWILRKLDVRQRRLLRTAAVRAFQRLREATAIEPSNELVSIGVPPAKIARAFVDRLAALHALLDG